MSNSCSVSRVAKHVHRLWENGLHRQTSEPLIGNAAPTARFTFLPIKNYMDKGKEGLV